MAAESDAVAERRERLRALRAAAELSSTDEQAALEQEPAPEPDVDVEEQDMKFRNYFPRDQQLQQNKRPPPVLPKFEDPVVKAGLENNGTEVQDPIVSIAPKKPNWDLRRDVAKKLEKLERRTQRTIIELMQEEERLRQAAAEDGMEQD